jgi:hypothetical protein
MVAFSLRELFASPVTEATIQTRFRMGGRLEQVAAGGPIALPLGRDRHQRVILLRYPAGERRLYDSMGQRTD